MLMIIWLQILMKGDNGFFLMVEGGKIDMAHHENTAVRAMSETIALDKAIETTMNMLGDELDDTLIIVTADHAHSLTISGYSDRGTDIRGEYYSYTVPTYSYMVY